MEGSILLFLQNMRVDFLSQLLALFSSLVNYGLLFILIGVVFFFIAQKRSTGMCLIISVILVALIGSLLIGHIVARPYPTDTVVGLTAVPGVSRAGYALPSFHVACCFAAIPIFAKGSGKLSTLFSIIFAIVIAFGRMYLGVNYPTDVLAGIALGLVIGILLARFLLPLFGNDQAQPVRKSVHKH